MNTQASTSVDRAESRWWLLVVLGVLWIIYAFIVLSANSTSVAAVAILFGVGFAVGGVVELMSASLVEEWKWVHIVFGLISLIAGVVALVWPGQTVLVLAALIGWYLMFSGIFGVILSIASRHENDIWWLGLILSGLEIALAVWAVGYAGRSLSLLLVWVGAAALARGITNIVTGLALHGADQRLKEFLGPRVV